MDEEEDLIEVEDVLQIIEVDGMEDFYLGEEETIRFVVDIHTTIFTEEELLETIIKVEIIKIIAILWEEILIEQQEDFLLILIITMIKEEIIVRFIGVIIIGVHFTTWKIMKMIIIIRVLKKIE